MAVSLDILAVNKNQEDRRLPQPPRVCSAFSSEMSKHPTATLKAENKQGHSPNIEERKADLSWRSAQPANKRGSKASEQGARALFSVKANSAMPPSRRLSKSDYEGEGRGEAPLGTFCLFRGSLRNYSEVIRRLIISD